MSNRARRHHIVPQTLQKHFCGSNGQLWYTERDENGRFHPPQCRTPKGSFWQRDYYTVVVNGEKSDEIEKKFYGSLDNLIGSAVPKFLLILGRNGVPEMDQELQESMKLAVFHMLLRSSDFCDHDETAIGHEYLDGLIVKYKTDEKYKAQLERSLTEKANPAKVRAYGRSIRVQGTLGNHSQSKTELMKRSFKWVKAPPRCSFVLSNQIGYRIGNGGPNGLRNPNSEIWMPISPDFALVLVRDEGRNLANLSETDRDHMRSINEYATRNSRAIGSASEKLIRSLTNH